MVACTARQALMLDTICPLPCDVSVPIDYRGDESARGSGLTQRPADERSRGFDGGAALSPSLRTMMVGVCPPKDIVDRTASRVAQELEKKKNRSGVVESRSKVRGRRCVVGPRVVLMLSGSRACRSSSPKNCGRLRVWRIGRRIHLVGRTRQTRLSGTP